MRIPDPKANTTTEAYLAYKAGYLEESELKPSLYEPYLHFDAWLAYWAGLVPLYPIKAPGKNIFNKYGLELGVNWSNNIGISLIGSKSINSARAVILVPVKPNTTYTISLEESEWYCMEVDEADKYGVVLDRTVRTVSNEFSETITTLDGVYMLGVKFKYGSAGTTAITKDMLSELKMQIEEGNSATEYEDYTGEPEMLTDEEALVAYLSGVTNTYPEEIKDPYDVRVTGYLRYLVSARFGRPDYPVNNEEFYLSNMKPPVVTNDTPSSSIELDDTAEAPFIDVKAYGDTSQTTYTGKNLFSNTFRTSGSTDLIDDGVRLVQEGSSSSERVVTFDFPSASPLEMGKTYTLSCNLSGTSSTVSFKFLANGSGSVGIPDKVVNIGSEPKTSFSFSPSTSDMDRLYIFINTNNPSGSTAILKYIQIEEGSTDTPFEPYVGGVPAPSPDYPQNVNVVTGRQVVAVTGEGGESAEYEINLGKNLINTKLLGSGRVNNINYSVLDDGSVRIVGTSTSSTHIGLQYKIPQSLLGKSLVQSWSGDFSNMGNVSLKNGSGDIEDIATLTKDRSSATFVVTQSMIDEVSNVDFWVSSGKTVDAIIKYQLEVGDTATEYAPYFEPIELCKIGDYQDYIYQDADGDWYLHKECAKNIYVGAESEDWRRTVSSDLVLYFISEELARKGSSSPMKTNMFIWSSVSNRINYIYTNSQGAFVVISPTSGGSLVANTVADYKTWLSSHNLYVYYSLADTTDTLIADNNLITQLNALKEGGSYTGKTYITVTSTAPNLPALLKVEAGEYR